MELKITLPSKVGIISIDKILNQAVDTNLNPKAPKVQYDFSHITWIDATGITVFSNLIQWLGSKKVQQEFINLNNTNDAISFLDDSLFFERYLGKKLSPSAKPRSTTVPLQLVRHANSQFWVEKKCIDWLSQKIGISSKALIELKICLFELFNNIRDHSGVDSGCIFIQHHPKKNIITISLSDFGVGIPSNVRKVLNNITDGNAVIQSLEEGFTTKSTIRNRGAGLHLLAQTVIRNEGDLSIRSERAHIFCSKNGIADYSNNSGYYAGTLFEINLSADCFDYDLANEEDFTWQL